MPLGPAMKESSGQPSLIEPFRKRKVGSPTVQYQIDLHPAPTESEFMTLIVKEALKTES